VRDMAAFVNMPSLDIARRMIRFFRLDQIVENIRFVVASSLNRAEMLLNGSTFDVDHDLYTETKDG
jgi:hypothetical protein